MTAFEAVVFTISLEVTDHIAAGKKEHNWIPKVSPALGTFQWKSQLWCLVPGCGFEPRDAG